MLSNSSAPIFWVMAITIICTISLLSVGRVDGFLGRYSPEEAEAIDKLRELMYDELYQDYMKSDDFLIPWLRTHNMDLQAAQTMLLKHLFWRKTNRMDTILNEDVGPLSKLLPVRIKGVDKQHRPLFIVYFGSWDVRKLVLAGHSAKYQRYLARQMEYASHRIRAINATSPTGNITQVLFIMDATGYNLRQHACVQCIPQHIAFVNTLESNYPFLASKMLIVNVPRVANIALEVMIPLLHPLTRKRFHTFGTDKEKWTRALLTLVDEDQLPTRLGGQVR